MAICAGVTLLIYFTASIIGAVVFLYNKIDESKKEILKDVSEKHKENDQRYNALSTLVTRHDILLNPEFTNGKAHVR